MTLDNMVEFDIGSSKIIGVACQNIGNENKIKVNKIKLCLKRSVKLNDKGPEVSSPWPPKLVEFRFV